MKDAIVLFIFIFVLSVVFFVGFQYFIRKPLNKPTPPPTVNAEKLFREQEQRMRDMERQQKNLLDNQKRQMRNMNYKY